MRQIRVWSWGWEGEGGWVVGKRCGEGRNACPCIAESSREESSFLKSLRVTSMMDDRDDFDMRNLDSVDNRVRKPLQM